MSNLIIMCGLPASGKSTIAKSIKNSIVISTDDIREEINGNASNQENVNLIFDTAFNRIKENLINKEFENVVFDATNINYKRRMDIINKFKKYANNIKCYFVWTSYEECLERNSKRNRKVPEEVIKRMYFNFYVPQIFEGFYDVKVIDNSNIKEVDMKYLEEKMNINQDNPNHTLTLLDHSTKTFEYVFKSYEDSHFLGVYTLAALLHDIGKLKTKTFINSKGEKTNIAHYYNHEKVGAYDSFLYTRENDDIIKLYIAKLIQWHMLLNQELSDKTIAKYKNLLGKKFWEDLKILHKADIMAR